MDRRDRRGQRRRAKQVQREIDGPVRRRETRAKQVEDAVSEAAQAEARRIMAEALERAGWGIDLFGIVASIEIHQVTTAPAPSGGYQFPTTSHPLEKIP